MAVQTSSITTAANGNLALAPNGTGQVRISTLSGNNSQPVGVDNNGELYQFNIADLTAGTPAGTDILMMEIGGVQQKVTAQQLVDGTSAISLTALSVTTAAAAGAGALAYNNGSGVFTFTPATLAGLGGIALTALSVTQNAAAGTGALTYSNTTGVFSYTPPTIGGLGGIGLGALSVNVVAASGAGNLTYSNTTGVFTYTPPTAAGLGAIALTSLSVTTAATGSATGGLAYNNTTGVFTYTPVAGGASLAAATAAEAAAGTLTTVYSSPETAVPKDAAGMTGALLAPGGTTGQRPGAPVTGMVRHNTDLGQMEWYDGTAWSQTFGGGGASSGTLTEVGGSITSFNTSGTGTYPYSGAAAELSQISLATVSNVIGGAGKMYAWGTGGIGGGGNVSVAFATNNGGSAGFRILYYV